MILCVGESLIDMISTEDATGSIAFVPHSGGAIFNTAIALGRLGASTALLSGLSRDMFGQQLYNALELSRVDRNYLIFSDRPTTLAFVRITNGEAVYSFFDENTAGRMLSIDDMPDLSDEVSALYCGGISLACEPGATAYEHIITQANSDRVVMLDPNIRASFIQDVPRYRQRLERMMSLADIVKVSVEDLNWIRPEPLPLGEKVSSIMNEYEVILIVTNGSEGATGYLPNGSHVSIKPEPVAVIDTVGAGDTFNAGVLAMLHHLDLLTKSRLSRLSLQTLEQAMMFGAKTAAISVSRAGANPPWAEELSFKM